MRVLLVHPNDFPDPATPEPLLPPNQAPPLGLAYIAGFLRDAGHQVAAHDMRHSPLDRERFGAVIRDFAPDVLGLGLYTVTVPVAEEISVIAMGLNPDAW